MFLIRDALAQAADAAVSPAFAGNLRSAFMFVFIFAVFYFLFVRPQNGKIKERDAMLRNIERGDTVITGGGIVGKVTRIIDDEEIAVEIAQGVVVTVKRERLFSVPDKDPALLKAKAVADAHHKRAAKLALKQALKKGKGAVPALQSSNKN